MFCACSFLKRLYANAQECPRSYDKLRFDPRYHFPIQQLLISYNSGFPSFCSTKCSVFLWMLLIKLISLKSLLEAELTTLLYILHTMGNPNGFVFSIYRVLLYLIPSQDSPLIKQVLAFYNFISAEVGRMKGLIAATIWQYFKYCNTIKRGKGYLLIYDIFIDLFCILCRKQECRLLATHDDYSMMSKLPKQKTSVVTILRNPVDRIFSTYEFSIEVAARFLVHPNLTSATKMVGRLRPGATGVSTLDIWPWKYLVPWMREDLFARVCFSCNLLPPVGFLTSSACSIT